MTGERRFDDAEVAEILERATSLEAAPATVPAPAPSGLTLAQLQEIGAEVGIPPERIAEAARAVSTRVPGQAPRTFLGAPRSVARIVPIPRPLDDDEWTRLVVALRETFGAEGRIRVHGPLRSWNNGNLQVHVEPDGDRYRIRMETLKGDTLPRAGFGAVAAALASVMIVTVTSGGGRPGALVAGGLLGLFGLGQVAYARAQLRGWAAERAAQMEALAERIAGLLGK